MDAIVDDDLRLDRAAAPATDAHDAAPPPPTAQARDELRLALSMRGGVSLAVWIGGAAAEIDRLTRCDVAPSTNVKSRKAATATDLATAYRSLLDLAGYDRAVIDVMTGASAGGLNGVILAASRAYGFEFDDMDQVWVELADIESMTRNPLQRYGGRDSRSFRAPSILDGDGYFLKELAAKLRELIGRGTLARAVGDPFSLVLAATLVEPDEDALDDDPFAEVVELRRSASFSFRFVGEPGDDNGGDFQSVPRAVDDGAASTVSLLALAGRATSSFPGAFEPATVTSGAGYVFSDPPAPGKERLVIDGGVLDNIPVRKAIEAVSMAPSVAGSDRWLVFLHPTPDERLATPPSSPAPRAVGTALRALAATLGQESLRDDLEELRRYNDSARRQRLQRAAALRIAGRDDPTGGGAAGAVNGRVADRREQITRYGSELRTSDPAVHARVEAQRAFAVLTGAIRVRRPLADPTGSAALTALVRRRETALEDAIADAYVRLFTERGSGIDSLHAPAALAQAVEVALSWIRGLRGLSHDQHQAAVMHGRRLAALHKMAITIQDWSDQAWLVAGAAAPPADGSWAFDTVEVATRQARSVPRALADDLTSAYDDEATATTGARTAVTAGRVEEALRHVDTEVRARISAGTWTTPEAGEAVDLADWLWIELGRETQRCANALVAVPADGSGADEVTRSVHQLLVAAATAGPDDPQGAVGQLLCSLVTIFAPYENPTRPGHEQIRFVRIASSNRSPLEASLLEPGEERLSADDKLCGNDYGNFAAFLSARWRLNDWMWGRLDAIKTIVDLLVRPERLHASGIDAERMRTIVVDVLRASEMALSEADAEVVFNELSCAQKSAAPRRDLLRTRELLTEALQRRVLADLLPLVSAAREHPVYPSAPTLKPSGGDDPVVEALTRYRVGREGLGDLDAKRRTQIGMRLAMVGWHAARPDGRGPGPRLVRTLVRFLKPFYLYVAFGALDRARALFLVNLMLVGWFVGPWSQRDAAVTVHRGDLTTSMNSWDDWQWWPSDAQPHGWTWLLFAVTVGLGLLGAVLLAQNVLSQTKPRRRDRRPEAGRKWHAGTAIAGIVGPLWFMASGVGTGPVAVTIGGAAIALMATWWMRRRWSAAVGVLTAGAYTATAWAFQLLADHGGRRTGWGRYSLWWSFVALYASMTIIATLCTYVHVLPRTARAGARRHR